MKVHVQITDDDILQAPDRVVGSRSYARNCPVASALCRALGLPPGTLAVGGGFAAAQFANELDADDLRFNPNCIACVNIGLNHRAVALPQAARDWVAAYDAYASNEREAVPAPIAFEVEVP